MFRTAINLSASPRIATVRGVAALRHGVAVSRRRASRGTRVHGRIMQVTYGAKH